MLPVNAQNLNLSFEMFVSKKINLFFFSEKHSQYIMCIDTVCSVELLKICEAGTLHVFQSK